MNYALITCGPLFSALAFALNVSGSPVAAAVSLTVAGSAFFIGLIRA